MKITIVTVVYNAADTLEQSILSVRSQLWKEVEHIVIDGASTDGSLEIIQRHGDKLSQWVSEPDQGIYHAMNKGLSLATGDIVGFLNADDIYQDEHVLADVASCFANDSVDGCYGDLVYVAKDNPDKVIRYWQSRDYRPGLFESGWMPAHPTFFVRRKVYQEFGCFDTRLRFQSDFELTARLMAVHGIATCYLPRILVRMRTGGITNRSLANIVRGNAESYSACKRLGLEVTPFYFLTKFALRVPQFFCRATTTAEN